MRKLLASKAPACDEGAELCVPINRLRVPLPLPKKTILNNWYLRNDSANVNAILHHDYLYSPRKNIDVLQNKPRSAAANVSRKCCLSTNTCYCRENCEKPKILARPRSCVILEDVEKRLAIPSLNRNSLKDCLCSDDVVDLKDITDAELLKLYRRNLATDKNDIQLTEQRKSYESYRALENVKDLEELKKLEEKQSEIGDKHQSVADVMASKSGINEEENTDSLPSVKMDIAKMRKFRDQHYFETHSDSFIEANPPRTHQTSDVCNSVSQNYYNDDRIDQNRYRNDEVEDEAIQQFKLDSRFLPVPVSRDQYLRTNLQKRRTTSSLKSNQNRKSTPTLKTFVKHYQLGLTPKTIYFGKDSTKIEFAVDEEELKKTDCFIGKIKMPQYRNTLALRQQKMRY